jgi:chloride channel 7
MRSRSLRIYPRLDKEYRRLESLDFQMVRSNIYLTRPSARLYSWIAFMLVAVVMGFIAFFIDLVVEFIESTKWEGTQRILDKGHIGSAWMAFLVMSLLLGGIAAVMTAYIAPGAAGGGTVELMGFFNGINYPKFIGIRTLIVKIIALILAVSSGLCIGKEGPLAHIGAIVGCGIVALPLAIFAPFQNDQDKREIAAAGAAAGVSAAFGSPIGGSLFAYEIARPTTFWSFGLMWKIFFCSSVSTFVLNILTCIKLNESLILSNAGLIKFG